MTMAEIPAVIYGVKSSPDEKGAVADQLRMADEAIKQEGGRLIIGVFDEENQSGYRKARGPQLEAAIDIAAKAAAEHGHAELWVWHSSRLGRGTGKKSAVSPKVVRALGKLLYDLQEKGVIVRSVKDNEFTTNEMLWGFASRQASKYAEDMSEWVKDGLRRRKEDDGDPVGAVAFGFMVEQVLDAEGKPVIKRGRNGKPTGRILMRRVVDPVLGPVVVIVYERFAAGESTADLACWLIEQGYQTIRGKQWNADAVRYMLENDSYEGKNGYPQIVDPELAARARAQFRRQDPAAVQRRKGGHPGKTPAALRGIAHCAGCGAPLYCLGPRHSRPRRYVCRNVHLRNGVCDRPWIPADFAETHVRDHIETIVGSLEKWIAEQLKQRSAAQEARLRTIDPLRDQLADLDARRQDRMSEIIDHGITSPVAFELIEQMDQERESLRERIADAEAMAAEWDGPPDANEMLDFYVDVAGQLHDRIATAEGAAVATALHDALAGMWLEIEEGWLLVEFAYRVNPTPMKPETAEKIARFMAATELPDGSAPAPAPLEARRFTLPPAEVEPPMKPETRQAINRFMEATKPADSPR